MILRSFLAAVALMFIGAGSLSAAENISPSHGPPLVTQVAFVAPDVGSPLIEVPAAARARFLLQVAGGSSSDPHGSSSSSSSSSEPASSSSSSSSGSSESSCGSSCESSSSPGSSSSDESSCTGSDCSSSSSSSCTGSDCSSSCSSSDCSSSEPPPPPPPPPPPDSSGSSSSPPDEPPPRHPPVVVTYCPADQGQTQWTQWRYRVTAALGTRQITAQECGCVYSRYVRSHPAPAPVTRFVAGSDLCRRMADWLVDDP